MPYTETTMLGKGNDAEWGTNLIPKQWLPDILKYQIESNPFLPFLQYFDALGAKKGDTVHIPRRTNITNLGTTALTSGTAVPTGSFETTQIDCTISEYGNSIRFETAWNDILSNSDIAAAVRDTLADDYTQSLAYIMNGAFVKACGTVFVACAVGSYHQGSTADYTDPTTYLEGTMLRTVRDWLRKQITPFAPNFPGYYVLMAHTDTLRYLKGDGDFANSLTAYAYSGDDRLKTDIAGAFGGFVIVENNYLTAGTSFAFGGQPLGWAVASPLQLKVDPDIMKDYGRASGVAWLSWFGTANVYPKYAARLVTAG